MNMAESSNKSMDRFLQKMRSELMFELRNIQHGERPVTGRNHRENIKQFLEKHVVPLPGDGKNILENAESSERHRPESIVVEVQGMIEKRPVTSILQSANFRRHLENIIRGSITPARREVTSIPRAGQSQSSSRVTPPQHNNHTVTNTITSETPRNSQSSSSDDLHNIPQRRVLVQRQESAESEDSFVSAVNSLDQDVEGDFDEDESQDAVDERVRPQEPNHNSGANILQSSRPDQQDVPIEGVTWNTINQVHREEIVQEISELLHSHLVSSALGGEFRATLELLVENRVSSSGTNGTAVEEFIHRLPRSGVQRNDFSHLGIAPAAENENWDNVSVTSVSTHSVPYAQTNTYLGKEIQSLKTQINEMKNMLKLTFDLQMDIQRSIRQEVAAAMNQTTAVTPPAPSRPVTDTHCLICLDRHTDTVLYQCGHMCVCYGCGRDLLSRGHNCPVCRAPIKDVIRAYKTNPE
ncbi:uncharacterized protein LOC131955950 [Physella acuta]|uniref:uncharacterized protein LOC131955950 n=1 Tax=Physella acuta TaxID=109671 RepID=UPI0027DAEA80|nr:uncharacterized protein LOC131955950 [Physella acuta]